MTRSLSLPIKSSSKRLWLSAGLVALCTVLLPMPAEANGDPEVILLSDFELGDVSSWSSVTNGPLPVTPTAFRFTEFVLKDPHIYIDLDVIGCTDVTNTDVPVINLTSVNGSAAAAIVTDADMDGCLDLSSMLLFRELDQTNNGELVDGRAGKCAPPAGTTTCSVDTSKPKGRSTYDNVAGGLCLGVEPGSANPTYVPLITETFGPCYVSDPADIELEILDGLLVPLKDFQTSATFNTVPATSLSDGLSRGFLREVDADALTIPAEIPTVGGLPVSILFPGGHPDGFDQNCAGFSDLDQYQGESGWWIYFNFSADSVPWTGL